VGDHQGLRPGIGAGSMFDYIVSGIVALFLLVYLGWAMFQPEKF
jgi:K+-transporting ATPase KdpF subunit